MRALKIPDLICKARVPRMRARSYLVMYRVVIRGLSAGLGGLLQHVHAVLPLWQCLLPFLLPIEGLQHKSPVTCHVQASPQGITKSYWG